MEVIFSCSTKYSLVTEADHEESMWNKKDIYKMQDGEMSCIWRERKESCLCTTGERKRVELMMILVLAGILRIV